MATSRQIDRIRSILQDAIVFQSARPTRAINSPEVANDDASAASATGARAIRCANNLLDMYDRHTIYCSDRVLHLYSMPIGMKAPTRGLSLALRALCNSVCIGYSSDDFVESV